MSDAEAIASASKHSEDVGTFFLEPTIITDRPTVVSFCTDCCRASAIMSYTSVKKREVAFESALAGDNDTGVNCKGAARRQDRGCCLGKQKGLCEKTLNTVSKHQSQTQSR